jgi:hypothetical protein
VLRSFIVLYRPSISPKSVFLTMNAQTVLKAVRKEAQPQAKTQVQLSTKLVSIREIIGSKCEEDYIVVGFMVKVTHANHDRQEDTSMKGQYSKKVKKNYNRIFQFADKEGFVFCVICDDDPHSRNIMKHVIDINAVGRAFALYEPKIHTGHVLRLDMPIIRCDAALMPLENSIYSAVRDIPLSPPTQGNETTFFHLSGMMLRFTSVQLIGKGDGEPPSCAGFFCDRKEPLKISHSCGCFTHAAQGNLSSVVLATDVISDLSKDQTKWFRIDSNRSFLMTTMFITSPESIGILQQQLRQSENNKVRKAVRECFEHINTGDRGGFTISGIITRGETHDASDQTQLIFSETVTYHATYIQPTKLEVLEQEAFVKLKYEYIPPTKDPPAIGSEPS